MTRLSRRLHYCTIERLNSAPEFAHTATLTALLLLLSPGCGLFEPRDPEPPSQSSLNYSPPTDPKVVISNLQSAIEQKNAANYISCFVDPAKSGQPFTFLPSADAQAQYGSSLLNWTWNDEQSYFLNLISRSNSNAFSSLALSLKSSSVYADSVIYSYEYAFTFKHSDASFPTEAKGVLWFTLRPDNSNFWAIHRWTDFSTQNAISWSHFKGRFSN
jgi:hypothetical protein